MLSSASPRDVVWFLRRRYNDPRLVIINELSSSNTHIFLFLNINRYVYEVPMAGVKL